jgi:hypothetical protein
MIALSAAAATLPALAESWQAEPIEAHEWGVMAFDADGAPISDLVPLPSWIYQRASAPQAPAPATVPTRALPADTGERELPILHFFAPRLWSNTAPLGLEVGFSHGVATAWFPQVDTLRSAAEDNSPSPPPPSDPTRQLIWDALTLSALPQPRPPTLTPPRDPAIPTEAASGHTLHLAEAHALLSACTCAP